MFVTGEGLASRSLTIWSARSHHPLDHVFLLAEVLTSSHCCVAGQPVCTVCTVQRHSAAGKGSVPLIGNPA
jgi:hypothetical protein